MSNSSSAKNGKKDYNHLQSEIEKKEKIKGRRKKKKMKVSGKSVKDLQQIIAKKGKKIK